MSEDRNVYVKKGRKYEPIGYWFEGRNDWLTEGVWVVCKHPRSKSITNGQYLKEQFGIDKVSDLKKPSFADLGGLHKMKDEVISMIDIDKYRVCSVAEQVGMIINALVKVDDAITPEKLEAAGWENKSTPTTKEFTSGPDYTIKLDYKDLWKVSNRWSTESVTTMTDLREFIMKHL